MGRDIYEEYHLRRVINASGTLTTYGQSAALPMVIETVADVLPRFFEMDVLLGRASEAIAQVSGAEAGFITASAAAGITLGIAACMTGTDPAKVAQLPDTTGMKDEVIIQMGHCCSFGAPVTQMIRLSGATVKAIGTVNGTSRSLFDASISERTVAAMYVISHHTTQYGYIPLPAFAETAHKYGVPVVVDAAAEEHGLERYIDAGADLVICSGHKHFRAPTSGLMAGRMDLIQACHAQNRGIGRGMKVGKEGIVGLMAALEAWQAGYHEERRQAEKARVHRFVERLDHLEGIQVSAVWPEPDPYPIMRAKVSVDPETADLNAMALVTLLSDGDPTIKTRSHHVEEGYFLLDPFTLTDEDVEFICDRIEEIAGRPAHEKQAVTEKLEGLSVADLWAHGDEWPYHAPGATPHL